MTINRQRAVLAFQEYTNQYNMEDDMIRLKVEHTYRVANLCERIAVSLELPEEERDLAWLIGLLHDVGRFEQQKNYGTFNDALSIDHAKYGTWLLFGDSFGGETYEFHGLPKSTISIRDFVEESSEDKVIWTAVFYHSAYRIPTELDKRTEMFCHIIRDADKIDILKANVEFPMEEIYSVTHEELYKSQVTKEVMQSFYEEHAVLRSLKRTAVDNVVGHISLVYELVYPISLRITLEQGNLQKLMDFASENQVTREQFAEIREKMNTYFTTFLQKL